MWAATASRYIDDRALLRALAIPAGLDLGTAGIRGDEVCLSIIWSADNRSLIAYLIDGGGSTAGRAPGAPLGQEPCGFRRSRREDELLDAMQCGEV